MAKVTLDTVSSGYLTATAQEANFDTIETEFNDNVLYRNNPVGEANEMNNDLDMNSQRILNLPDAVNSQEPATLAQLLVGVTATSGVFFIPNSTEPATPTGGGNLYVDTADGALKFKNANGTVVTIATGA